jgi:hypothetical protein
MLPLGPLVACRVWDDRSASMLGSCAYRAPKLGTRDRPSGASPMESSIVVVASFRHRKSSRALINDEKMNLLIFGTGKAGIGIAKFASISPLSSRPSGHGCTLS